MHCTPLAHAATRFLQISRIDQIIIFLLFPDNLRSIDKLIGRLLVYVIIQPVGIHDVPMGSPLQHRPFSRIIIRIIIAGQFNGKSFFPVTLIFLIQGQTVIFRMSHHENLASVLIDHKGNPCLLRFRKNGQILML